MYERNKRPKQMGKLFKISKRVMVRGRDSEQGVMRCAREYEVRDGIIKHNLIEAKTLPPLVLKLKISCTLLTPPISIWDAVTAKSMMATVVKIVHVRFILP
ncbi:hypothetical protein DFH09DRAFT_1076160 [Mycena vulgaris]|nr:hypothetical protein DFH09DRAFT_1076160 [Mycena vulgaris]